MKAAVVTAPEKIQIMDVPKPVLSSPEDIIVKVEAASICNTTDYKIYSAKDPTSLWPFKPHPFILGHECSGEVIELGSGVKDIHEGDRVVFWTIPGGAFAEYVSVSTENVAIGEIDNRIPVFIAPIMEMVIGAARLLFNSDGTRIIRKGIVVVVYGLGPAGLIYVQLAKALGAGKIIAVGRRKLRLEKALLLGANITIDTDERYIVDRVKEVGGTPDVVIDATGSDIVAEVLALSHPGMVFVPYGIPPFNWEEKLPLLVKKGIIFRNGGVMEARAAIGQCIAWVASGVIRLEPIVTHRLSLEQVEFGLNLCHNFRDDTLKVVIDIPSKSPF